MQTGSTTGQDRACIENPLFLTILLRTPNLLVFCHFQSRAWLFNACLSVLCVPRWREL